MAQPNNSERILTVLESMSKEANTNLDRDALRMCVNIIQRGVDAGVLADVVNNIKEEVDNAEPESEWETKDNEADEEENS